MNTINVPIMKVKLNAETDWSSVFGLSAMNKSTMLYENTSYTEDMYAVMFDNDDIMFDESDVSNIVLNWDDKQGTIEYLLYTNRFLVGYVYMPR